MNPLRLFLLLLLTTVAGCDLSRLIVDKRAPQASAPDSKMHPPPELWQIRDSPKNVVLNLSPAPIRITLAGLPQPFASQSASKSPNVVPIPQNSTCARWPQSTSLPKV